MEYDFDLKLSDGQCVTWPGRDGEDAAHRYADAHPGAVVVAWRWPVTELRVGMIRIED